MSDVASISEKAIQILKPFLFVWLDSNVNQSEQIRTAIQILERNQIDICSIDGSVKFEQWFESNQSKKQIILIICNKFGKKIIPTFHDSHSIIAIYMYSLGHKINKRWTQKYSKVCNVSSDTNQLIKRISRNLTDSTMMDAPKSHNLVRKRSNDYTDLSPIENPSMKRIKIQSGMCQCIK